jgi:hypothetical protein
MTKAKWPLSPSPQMDWTDMSLAVISQVKGDRNWWMRHWLEKGESAAFEKSSLMMDDGRRYDDSSDKL